MNREGDPLWYFGASRQDVAAHRSGTYRRALDVGCGAGHFGALLKSRNCVEEIWGIEGDPQAAKEAERKLDSVINGYAPSALANLSGKFDIVFFNDSLEHMVDPWLVLRSLREYLSKDALVVASSPNIRFAPVLWDLIFKSDFSYREAGVLDKTHLRFFTKKTMTAMFEECEYSDVTAVGLVFRGRLLGRLLNLLTMGLCRDMFYERYLVTAKMDAPRV